MFIVYCHVNLKNGKRYVGWTSKTISQRWREHIGGKSAFAKAIRKHGIYAWTHIVLEQCSSKDDAKTREIYWGRHHTNEAKARIRNNSKRHQVDQLTLSGHVIATYTSIAEAARLTAHPDRTKIGLCCRGKRQSTLGFRWRFHPLEEK